MRIRYIFFRIIMPLLFVLTLTSGWYGNSSRAAAREKESVSSIKYFIRVPITRQNENYTCGVTALQSILGYYGFEKRIGELSFELKPDPENGTNYLKIANYVKAQGFSVNVRTEMSLEELKGKATPA
ncbi:MAG: cysteine peptidase family C39 domain-containing protein [Negativicutes bacterium]